MALSKDAREWLEAQNNEFLHAYSCWFEDDEAREFLDETFDLSEDDNCAGWYARLSAPGYMDCTEWQGPYPTEDEAFEALYEQYGD